MLSHSLCSPRLLLHPQSFPLNRHRHRHRHWTIRRPRALVIASATPPDDDDDGGFDMDTLRRRVEELSKSEVSMKDKLLEELIEWEKKCNYTFYDSDMWEISGMFQLHRGEAAKPKASIGLTVMVTVGLPIPVLVIILYLMDAAKGVLSKSQIN
ncbi:hypothetical protein QJS10_CPB14g00300 [Acorus calamus]|uniref:Uncharacterized protein n=1 Tax=Acorus calamus TaxID=4465 RepID=A0AAV9DD31_ACOCL|nr:hypothetical protein QJS10_CPB14g00300 [Acorus calamus]